MEITVADQRMLVFDPQITRDEAKEKAREKKVSAFGTITQVASLFSKPSDDDFELIYEEFRMQPYWHVAAKARYVYDRVTEYQVPASSRVVTSITHKESKFDVTNGHFHIPCTEHCIQEESEEVYVDGITGKPDAALHRFAPFSPRVVDGNLQVEKNETMIIVPPQSRVSAIMRDSLAKMIKGIQADTIHEEHVEVTCVDLYYHPMYAFQFRWKSKHKEAIVEVDGMTGTVSAGARVFSQYLGKAFDRDFLFDIGADAAGALIPGGSIAVKAVKKYIDTKRSK